MQQNTTGQVRSRRLQTPLTDYVTWFILSHRIVVNLVPGFARCKIRVTIGLACDDGACGADLFWTYVRQYKIVLASPTAYLSACQTCLSLLHAMRRIRCFFYAIYMADRAISSFSGSSPVPWFRTVRRHASQTRQAPETKTGARYIMDRQTIHVTHMIRGAGMVLLDKVYMKR
jgi:hypothetical protein